MFTRAAGDPRPGRRHLPSPSTVLAGGALFVALGGTAVAADKLVRTHHLAPDAVTSAKIKNGTVVWSDLQPNARAMLRGRTGPSGANGATGATGSPGAAGANGLSGTNGSSGANGAGGPKGDTGAAGVDGTDGTDGADGVLGPLSTTAGFTPLPTATPPTVVVSLTVPSGNYVVFAKSQVTHSGAGDTVACTLKAGTTIIDTVAMKTLPALAAMPMSLQAVTTTPTTLLTVECDVTTADGSATHNSLIALPVS